MSKKKSREYLDRWESRGVRRRDEGVLRQGILDECFGVSMKGYNIQTFIRTAGFVFLVGRCEIGWWLKTQY